MTQEHEAKNTRSSPLNSLREAGCKVINLEKTAPNGYAADSEEVFGITGSQFERAVNLELIRRSSTFTHIPTYDVEGAFAHQCQVAYETFNNTIGQLMHEPVGVRHAWERTIIEVERARPRGRPWHLPDEAECARQALHKELESLRAEFNRVGLHIEAACMGLKRADEPASLTKRLDMVRKLSLTY